MYIFIMVIMFGNSFLIVCRCYYKKDYIFAPLFKFSYYNLTFKVSIAN